MTAWPSVPLHDGRVLPALGLGTYPLADHEAREAVRGAIGIGYRLIDTAANYGNEIGVGRGIADAGVPREEIVLTTKLPGRDHGYEETLASFEESRERLGVEYVDLYLIHWPNPRVGKYVDSWRAMIKLRDEGRIRSIGVSNFTDDHLDQLERETGEMPVVNQIELHPFFPQARMRAADRDRRVVTQSWSPLGRAKDVFDQPEIATAAEAHDVTPAQVVLRWHHQLGVVAIPKSASPERQRSNAAIFGFELTEAEMDAIDGLERGRMGGDPEEHEEF
ncbi:aldo/keto reductase [Streptomyces sp. SID3343]|uniref:aldo/keto reductase n=1 Tax=Streptomyces sp. SID3343 TaxID=2690260 RepID=UPI00136F9DE9|nr:aldo/keto reductase [Streptomyces sp. SID3343]MYW04599.1 aldo/keto reductase [Streptomyces sp. SID3343]